MFTPTEEEQVSVAEDAPAPGIVHEAPHDVHKVGESDSSRAGEVPKRSYASIVSNLHLGCVVSPLYQAAVRFWATLPSRFNAISLVYVIIICR